MNKLLKIVNKYSLQFVGIISVLFLMYFGVYQKYMMYHLREIHFKNGEIINDYFRQDFQGNLHRKYNEENIIYSKESMKMEIINLSKNSIKTTEMRK